MNILFSGKFSERAWHVTLRHPVHRQHLLDWLYGFLAGGWVDRDDDIPLHPNQDNRYDTTHISGVAGELTICCNPNDCDVTPDGPLSHEFDWVLRSYPVDRYGVPDTNQPRVIINGGFINHSHDEFNPEWSVHT